MFSALRNRMNGEREDEATSRPLREMPGLTQGLSGRLLLLTIIFVMIAEILILSLIHI